jgi:hypothetical protein
MLRTGFEGIAPDGYKVRVGRVFDPPVEPMVQRIINNRNESDKS